MSKGIRKGWVFLCLMILLGGLSAGAAERKIPDVLRVTQDIETEKLDRYRIITYSVLHSAREDIDAAVNARVAALRAEAEPLVPPGKDFNTRISRADICTQITRTGSRWMSFHICARVSADNNQQWVKSEEYTYDMESGRLIRLGEIIREEGWEPLLQEIRRQAENSFPEDEPDREALDRLCRRENLSDAGFVMTPGHMALYFPAGEVYPGHPEALLRAEIYVPELAGILTEDALRETDCSGYDMIALTYDDGPGKGTTRGVLNASARHPGQVTFFTVGNRLVKNAELLHMEYDAGHSVQSHTWEHATSGATKRKNARWEQKTNETMGRLIGAVPVMMRPPGGHWRNYREAGCEMPMILWSVSSADALTDETDDDVIHCFGVAAGAGDGDIVLFHDIKRIAGKLAERCMERYEAENILLVTVNDLCALRGIPLEKDLLLESCPGEGKDPGGNEPPAADGAPEHIGSSDDS